MLHVEIPLHDVVALRIVLEERTLRRGRGEQWGTASEECSRTRVTDCAGSEEGCCHHIGDHKLIRQRQNVEQSKPAANGRLAVSEWIPSKADAGCKISKRWVPEARIARGGRASGKSSEIGHLPANFGKHTRRFIA